MRHVGHGRDGGDPVAQERGFEIDAASGQHGIDARRDRLVALGVTELVEPSPAQNLQRLAQPLLADAVDEGKFRPVIHVRDVERDGVQDHPVERIVVAQRAYGLVDTGRIDVRDDGAVAVVGVEGLHAHLHRAIDAIEIEGPVVEYELRLRAGQHPFDPFGGGSRGRAAVLGRTA